jgi:hypothetical protein
MKLAAAVTRMCEAFGLLDASVASSPAELEAMLAEVGATECTAAEFLGVVKRLQPRQAANLLTCTLHRSSAYCSHEFMPLEEARVLAADFIDAAGPGATLYSTGLVSDELRRIGPAYVVLTTSVFETVLYCVGAKESALLLVKEDD